MIYFSDIEPCRSVVLQLAAVLLVAKVMAYMNFLETRRCVQNGHKLLNVIEVTGMVPRQTQCYALSILSLSLMPSLQNLPGPPMVRVVRRSTPHAKEQCMKSASDKQ